MSKLSKDVVHVPVEWLNIKLAYPPSVHIPRKEFVLESLFGAT